MNETLKQYYLKSNHIGVIWLNATNLEEAKEEIFNYYLNTGERTLVEVIYRKENQVEHKIHTNYKLQSKGL